MLRFFSFTVICVIAIAGCSSQPNSSAKVARGEASALVGKPAPEISLKDLDGKSFSLAALKGKPVFIDFWATWCPPCRQSVPEVMKLHDDYGPRGLEVVSISLDDGVEPVRRFVDDYGMDNVQLFAGDSSVPGDYAIRGIPMFVLIDKDGGIKRIWTGFIPSMAPEWRSEVDSLLAANAAR